MFCDIEMVETVNSFKMFNSESKIISTHSVKRAQEIGT